MCSAKTIATRLKHTSIAFSKLSFATEKDAEKSHIICLFFFSSSQKLGISELTSLHGNICISYRKSTSIICSTFVCTRVSFGSVSDNQSTTKLECSSRVVILGPRNIWNRIAGRVTKHLNGFFLVNALTFRCNNVNLWWYWYKTIFYLNKQIIKRRLNWLCKILLRQELNIYTIYILKQLKAYVAVSLTDVAIFLLCIYKVSSTRVNFSLKSFPWQWSVDGEKWTSVFPSQGEASCKLFLVKVKLTSLKFAQGYYWFSKLKLVQKNLLVVYTNKKTLSIENCKGKLADHQKEQ